MPSDSPSAIVMKERILVETPVHRCLLRNKLIPLPILPKKKLSARGTACVTAIRVHKNLSGVMRTPEFPFSAALGSDAALPQKRKSIKEPTNFYALR
jgi:hypothetical protein